MWSIRSKTSPRALFAFLSIVLITFTASAAADHRGRVTFSGMPVPGATVTATKAEVTRSTVTDEQGIYRFVDLPDGTWSIEVAMLGFATQRQDVVVAAEAPPPEFALTLRPFAEIAAGPEVVHETSQATPPPVSSASTASATPQQNGFQRVGVKSPAGAAPPAPESSAASRAPEPTVIGGSDRSADAADGFLINGSVNNGAASPFAQLAAFGNNRRGPRSLYNGCFGVQFGNSALDARPAAPARCARSRRAAAASAPRSRPVYPPRSRSRGSVPRSRSSRRAASTRRRPSPESGRRRPDR